MSETDDDWMNPRTSAAFIMPPPKNGTFYQIQRKRATPVSGNVSHIYSWKVWEEFDTKDERDTALAALRERNPAWHLRGRVVTYLDDNVVSPDPTEYMDF